MPLGMAGIMAALRDAVDRAPGFVELRHHRVALLTLQVRDDRLTLATSTESAGIHVRVAEAGRWGTAVAAHADPASIATAIAGARSSARSAGGAAAAHDLGRSRPRGVLCTGVFDHGGVEETLAMPVASKIEGVRGLAKETRRACTAVGSVCIRYRELYEERVVVTSDGACAGQRLMRPDAAVVVIASEGGRSATLGTGAGVAGGWSDLWRHPSLANAAENTARTCVELMRAPAPERGPANVVLSPSLTGLLAHEAVGHLLEYDCVHDASIAQGQRGSRIGSDHVHVLDVGMPADERAAGFVAFDDEGTAVRPVKLIDGGLISGYLHDSASAARVGELPTGNARGWSCTDPPLIRMRNTYLAPGDAIVEEMIAELGDGYVFAGTSGGQSESNGNIVLTCPFGWRVEAGRKKGLVRGATLSGNAVGVLLSIDRVSRELEWAGGADFCQRGQPARVDAGGGHVRCRLTVSAA